MFKKFFETATVDAFAVWAVDELKRLRPPERLESEAKAALRQREQFEASLQRRAASFAATAKLNFYQKARLGARLEGLVEAAGYPRVFGQTLSRDVVRMVAMASLQKR